MVKHFTILVTALLLGMAMSAQTWVSFGKNQPTAPEFSVINSNDQKVVFTMDIYGMFVETKIEGSQTFKRLSLPECGVAGDIGSPDIMSEL